MDKQVQKVKPDYKKIYLDILNKKYPHKKEDCRLLLAKDNLSVINIIELNQKIFGSTEVMKLFNQKLRSYSKSDILQILDYQKKNNLNNTQLAKHFNLSRNTVAKWRKIFSIF